MICVLHNNCWNNNLLCRYEEERPVDARMIGWQVLRLGHPVFDVLQFLYSPKSNESRAKHMHQFLNRYYDAFERALRLSGCPILEEHNYRRASFLQDVQKRLWFALYYSFIALPILCDTASCT